MTPFLSSLTRIAKFRTLHERKKLPRQEWATGDYVVGRVAGSHGRQGSIELPSGRMVEVNTGDEVVGVLGTRTATLEIVGDWEAMNSGEMHALSAAGLFGKMTSVSPFLPPPMPLVYEGHVLENGVKQSMNLFKLPLPSTAWDFPVLLIIGTSMSSGKTSTAKVIIRRFVERGKRVVGAKLTGTGRYRDTLAMQDAGASVVVDFVDAGLPSTVCPEPIYRESLELMLRTIQMHRPDVLVAEIGASPLEPYNGATAVDVLGSHVRCTALCASDPYAVVGVMKAFERRPDFVAGVATNTEAGISLIRQMTGLPALNVFDPRSTEKLDILLDRCWA